MLIFVGEIWVCVKLWKNWSMYGKCINYSCPKWEFSCRKVEYVKQVENEYFLHFVYITVVKTRMFVREIGTYVVSVEWHFILFFCKHHCYPKWEILHEEIWLWQVWNEYFLHFVSIIISQRMGNLNFVCTSLSSPMKNFPWELWSAFLNKSQLQQLCSSTLSLLLLYQFLVPVEFQENFAQIVFLKCHVLCSTCRPETVRTSGFLLIWQTRHWIHNPKANS